MNGQTVTFTERLNQRAALEQFTGVVVGRLDDCLIVRVGEGKHQQRFLVDQALTSLTDVCYTLAG